jgi:hypothetical protein
MTQKSTSKDALRHLRPSDLRGVAQLATQATRGVTRIVEGVHQSVYDTMGVPGGPATGQTRGVTGLVYKSIHGVTQAVGKALDMALTGLMPLLESAGAAQAGSAQRETVLAILNGVMGDHLVASGNPLAISMTLRHQGQALRWDVEPRPAHLAGAAPKALLMIHGLCMNDLQWHTEKDGKVVDHGETISAALGYTPIHVRYNTGLHTSQNGHQLAAELEQMVQHWPVPLEEITVLVHSMGGLLIRSALYYAQPGRADLARHVEKHRLPGHAAPRLAAGAGGQLGRHDPGQHALHRAVCAPGQAAQRRHHRPALRPRARRRLAGP